MKEYIQSGHSWHLISRQRESNKAGYTAEDAFPLVLVVVLLKNGTFGLFQLVCVGWTNQPTDQWTDRPSYRDARTHLKSTEIKKEKKKKKRRKKGRNKADYSA